MHHDFSFLQLRYDSRKKKVKEVNLYCAFIVVPQTQCTQVRITQCYLQITPYLPLPHKHAPDGASPRLRLWTSNCCLLLICLPRKDERLSRPDWLTYSRRFTHSPTLVITRQPQVERSTAKVRLSETDVPPLCHATNYGPILYRF